MSGADPRADRAVLIVEDEVMTRMVAADAIADAGIPTHEAADAAEALQALRDYPAIKLLFTDINMPGRMDGLQLAKKVCDANKSISLIVTSGAVDLKDQELPGSGTFLAKPYAPQRLLQLVVQKLREKL
jgi:CheY-like chemotaxis protein